MQSSMYESDGRDEFALGDSPQVRDARRRVLQAAADQCALLLRGEAGTGRQTLAKHSNSHAGAWHTRLAGGTGR